MVVLLMFAAGVAGVVVGLGVVLLVVTWAVQQAIGRGLGW